MSWGENTEQDLIDEIWEMSELEGVTRPREEVPAPPSILAYRARMASNNNSSIYDTPQPQEDVTYIISGRGRGGISLILKPGVSTLSDNKMTEELRRKIQEVSGLGYSNELIVEGVKARQQANRDRAALSNASQQRKTNLKKTSGLCSPVHNQGSSSCCGEAPPPLSVMRKRAQEEREKKKVEVPKSDVQHCGKTSIDNNCRPLNRNSPSQSSSRSTSSELRPWSAESTQALFKPTACRQKFELTDEEFPSLK